MSNLPLHFFQQSTLSLAKHLLGKILVRRISSTKQDYTLKGMIVETEAYLAARKYNDMACHAYRGITERNKIMFEKPGVAYVYFTYGNHYMLNVVSEPEGEAAAVLIRALDISNLNDEEALSYMKETRNQKTQLDLTNGPGKLTKAFSIDKELNGVSLLGNVLYIEDAPTIPKQEIAKTSRIGIRFGTHHQWRFYIRNNPFVSKGKPSTKEDIPKFKVG